MNEAITRYYTLLRISFEKSMVYKIFETVNSQIYRFIAPIQTPPQAPKNIILADVSCPTCTHNLKIQFNLKKDMPVQDGAMTYPIRTGSVDCPKCGKPVDLKQVRQHVESQFGLRVV